MRTGVTVILPRGKASADPVFGVVLAERQRRDDRHDLDRGSGFLEGPILITNTHSVGVVRDAIIAVAVAATAALQPWSLPVVAETWDGRLNDINGFHVKPEHVLAALDGARAARSPRATSAAAPGWCVTASRAAPARRRGSSTRRDGGYTVGVLVQCNYGARRELRVAGVPVGQEIPICRARRRDRAR